MLTPNDLLDPTLNSGYSHVGYNVSPGQTVAKPYQAYDSRPHGPTRKHRWKGPRRATAPEAAQDYCNYVNQGGAAPAPSSLKTAGHSYDNIYAKSRDEEVEAALGVLRDHKAQREGRQGYVYCIREAIPGGGFSHIKIGYSTNPWKRVAELQTGNPRPLALVCMKKGTPSDEKALHQKYIQQNFLQEWFTVTKEMLLEFDLNADGVPYAGSDRAV